MKIKVENPNNQPMAVLVDKQKRTTEVVDSEYVSIATFVVNQVSKVIQISLVWGGYDSKGQWHIDHSRPAASISISGDRPEEAELYKRLALCNGEYNCQFDEQFFKRLLYNENVIQVVNDRIWGFADCSVTMDGDEIFSKGKAGGKPPKAGSK